MKTVNIQEAKTHLSRLVEQCAGGEEIVIAKAGKPMAQLVPYRPQASPRQGGQLAGQIEESPDCWEPDEAIFDESLSRPLFTPPRKDAPMRVAEPTTGGDSPA